MGCPYSKRPRALRASASAASSRTSDGPASPDAPAILADDRGLAREVLGKLAQLVVAPTLVGRECLTINQGAARAPSATQSPDANPSRAFKRVRSERMASSALPAALTHRADGSGTGLPARLPSVGSEAPLPRPPPASRATLWTQSRRLLEEDIQLEKGGAAREPDLLSEERRLQKRLGRLRLDMYVMEGDGACQFRAVSFGLYGSQDYHRSVRKRAVAHLAERRADFADYLGSDYNEYVAGMAQQYTWGDELTLRAICDAYGIVVNVITSDQQHWFMRYQPAELKLDLEIFLTYIAPIHYNAVRRRTSLARSSISRKNSLIQQAIDKHRRESQRAMAVDPLPPPLPPLVTAGSPGPAPASPGQFLASAGRTPASPPPSPFATAHNSPFDAASAAGGVANGEVPAGGSAAPPTASPAAGLEPFTAAGEEPAGRPPLAKKARPPPPAELAPGASAPLIEL